MVALLTREPRLKRRLAALERDVAEGRITPAAAAAEALDPLVRALDASEESA